jgi:ankyrin repeat protein
MKSFKFSSINQFEAAETGLLAWFQYHKTAGTLPDLMLTDASDYYPHDLAAENGYLEILRYLVEESGQVIDLTADDSYPLRYAAEFDHLHIIRYLIEDSGQPVDVFANDTEILRIADESSFDELRVYLETVLPLIENLGLDIAREFLKSQSSESTKNTAAFSTKGRI